VRRGTSNIDVEIARVDCPVVIPHVVVGEGAAIERDGNVASFAWIELNLGEALQLFDGARNGRVEFTDVNFGNFGARARASIGDVEVDGD